MEYPVKVQMQYLDLSDSIFSVGLLLKSNETIFSLVTESARPSTYTGDKVGAISGSIVFRLSSDRVTIQRIVYSFLDYLGDIGGLFGILTGFASTFSLILNFNGVYHLLTSVLFSVESKVAVASKQRAEDLSGLSSSVGSRRKSISINMLAKGIVGRVNKQAD